MSSLHFLRPWWLLLIPAALAIAWLWRRRFDALAQWRQLIDARLLPHLLLHPKPRFGLRPVDSVALALALGGIAIAGPTWEREPPPFGQDLAPLVIALDLADSMNAIDVQPSRLERAKQKIHDLLELRAGSRTGLIAYSGMAHLVLPPAEDTAVMDLYLPALQSELMPKQGRNAAAALDIAVSLLAKEQVATGTVLFITDGFDTAQIERFRAFMDDDTHQVLVLTVGTLEGGPLRSANGSIRTDADGRPMLASLDQAALEQLASTADVPIASSTLDSSDLEWVQRRAQHHLQIVQERNGVMRWKESGYYLCFPIALFAALWFRRGWVVRWAAATILICATLSPTSSYADGIIDWFATPDQQGRWYFERGDYRAAALHFQEPRWKGIALYRAADYANALMEFSRLDSADGFFLQGNAHARLKKYDAAVKSYDNALQARPEFPAAKHNRDLVAALMPQPEDEQTEQTPDLPPDQVQFDDKGKKGKDKVLTPEMIRKQTADLWMKNLQVSPADFLRQKFRIEAEAGDQ
ncbi:VWA domain-containing protein [Povalibacter sp.]|uniref:VWA domain-containing protein n=1 Tax=Povalibacter sp. TaxID=1962978 RepID=UPI002F421590